MVIRIDTAGCCVKVSECLTQPVRQICLIAVAMLGGLYCAAAHASPPTAPAGIGAQVSSSGSVNLYWSESSDDGFVTGYEVSRNHVTIWSGTETSYRDHPPANGLYYYSVRAVDNDSLRSGDSSIISINIQTNSSATSIAVGNNPTAQCIDSDGDGYGWDGEKTCLPDGNSAGQSVNSPDDCIDDDGDGYGWDGNATCIPDATTSDAGAQSANDSDSASGCDYSAASQNAGWGWNSELRVSCEPR